MKKMNEIFRKLTKDEIEVRVGFSKDDRVNLLLYIDSRAVVHILDEAVGPMGWQTEFQQCCDLIIGKLGLWDEEKKQWIWKADVGSASNIEKDKGLISDCYKRLLARWGVTELYSTPTISIKGNKYEKYKVNSITIDDNRTITSLSIVDSKGNVVFNWAIGQPQPQQYVPTSNQGVPPPRGGVISPNNLIEADGHLTKAFYRKIMNAKNTNELKAIWKEHKDLKENTYFVSTMKKRKGELAVYDL